MIILGVDAGMVRTGISVCDKGEILASPVCVINETDSDKLVEKIADIAFQKGAELIAVGLPKNMDGSEGASAERARELAAKITALSGIECVMQDERGTTITAHNYMNELNVRGKKRKNVIDAAAAVIILQDYLEYRRIKSK